MHARSLRIAAWAIGLFCLTLSGALCDELRAEKFSDTSSQPLELDYLLSLPEGYQDSDKAHSWPLLVFLHGAGERGDEIDKVKIHGPPMLVSQGRKFPCITVSPQCPEGSWWPWEPVIELIEHIQKTHRVDPSRIYLCGLSMGGYGTWHFATKHPDKFAAVVPICGGGTPYLCKRIPHLPVWAFHGAKDKAVPLSESERMIEALKKFGNKEAKLTIYPDAGHNSWTEAFASDSLYEWLFSHQKQP